MAQPRLRDSSGQFTSWGKLYDQAKDNLDAAAANDALVGEIGQILNIPQKIDASSTCVATYTYHPDDEQLEIEFQERGTYVYYSVSLDEYANFNGASSKGTYFNLYIRDRYEYERIA